MVCFYTNLVGFAGLKIVEFEVERWRECGINVEFDGGVCPRKLLENEVLSTKLLVLFEFPLKEPL